MLSGKAIARAVRGHLMVYAALNTMLTANAYNIPLPTIPDDSEDTGAELDDAVHDETSDDAYNIPLPTLQDGSEDTGAELDDTVHDETSAASESTCSSAPH